MSNDENLKSAYDLAMERLRAKDRADGVKKSRPLTAAQKKKIAELRRNATAKLAEMEILHRKDLDAAAADAEKTLELEEQHRIDRRRVESSLDDAVARVRGSGK